MQEANCLTGVDEPDFLYVHSANRLESVSPVKQLSIALTEWLTIKSQMYKWRGGSLGIRRKRDGLLGGGIIASRFMGRLTVECIRDCLRPLVDQTVEVD